MDIRKAEIRDLAAISELACQLWPNHSVEAMQAEMAEILTKPDGAFYLALAGETAVGFAQCQLRRDYVEGTDGSPVGYLEGIYVAEGCRKQGIARELLKACENWAKEMGCVEFASDCELTNTESLKFHLNVGFAEANRIICFVKKL
jgi:aminoglycoside 6'-N-acetyltransferase I